MAYIILELGSFEDTVGRVNHDEFDILKGSRSSSFFYKTAAKIPVDAVGVHRYPLDTEKKRSDLQAPGTDSRTLGCIIVRVALEGGIKLVSVESPFVVKSNADADLLCEIRDHNGLSLLWRCLLPKSDGKDASSADQEIVSVPADIVPFIHDGSYVFSATALSRESSSVHETELLLSRSGAVEVPTPPPFSRSSINRGLIDDKEIALLPFLPKDGTQVETGASRSEKVHLSVCSVRIGSFSEVKSGLAIPEQRMLFFRSPLVIRNNLALPIAIQLRVKVPPRLLHTNSSNVLSAGTTREATLSRQIGGVPEWEDIGILDCGQSVNWTGAFSTDKVELRVKFVGSDGAENSRRFPSWSTAVTIPPKSISARATGRPGSSNVDSLPPMRVLDASNVPLLLSVAVEGGSSPSDSDPGVHENIRRFAQSIASANRVISVYVPYWIVDGTGLDLEFFSGALVAGQLHRRISNERKGGNQQKNGLTMGLAELLEDDMLMHLPSRSPFEVMMIGENKSTRLTVRMRETRKRNESIRRNNIYPWSDPILLLSDQAAQHDITVLSPLELSNAAESSDASDSFRYVLRSRTIHAPERFGGNLTKLIHVVNRWAIVNELGRDIEIATEYGRNIPFLVKAVGRAQPFHFDDSSPIRFRFKEFGWSWSGKFSAQANSREVTLRLRHNMKGYTVIATVDFQARKSATSLIVFRVASHPPFRLENHTMHPLYFGQSTIFLGSDESALDSMLLPYQNADFAWDEPEVLRRAVTVKAAGTDLPNSVDAMLGRFYLDRIAPGMELNLESRLFKGECVPDGPTRVLRISDASMPRLPSFRRGESNEFHRKPQMSSLSVSLAVKLAHGIGVSVVDWSPQELLYIRLDDILLERNINPKRDAVSVAVGNIKVNNQMWVTPYPVLLKMGRRLDSLHGARRRNRRHNAVSLSWQRALNTHGGYGDLTMLERVELATEPAFINADGNLAELLEKMVLQVSGTRTHDHQILQPLSRNADLRKVLGISGSEIERNERTKASSSKKALATFDWGSSSDFMATAALAAKLRNQHFISPTSGSAPPAGTAPTGKEIPSSLSKPLQKYYIEKLRISAAKAELSWSGPLPGALSSLLLQALTFENLPLRLRQFSSTHAYGTAENHLQAIKSHYLSFWRIVDLLMGLSYNPTFLIRAVVFTCRESFASILDSWSDTCMNAAERLMNVMPKVVELQPSYDDGLPLQHHMSPSLAVRRVLIRPFVALPASILRGSANVNAWWSSLLRYGPQDANRTTRGLVRSRNPRLFASVDGKDLLVEYVEGENAGKALLSRVRMGMYLGEGYIFHTEGTLQGKAKSMSPNDMDSAPLIVMITSERVLLLDGKLDRDFCSVKFEVLFENLVHAEMTRIESKSSSEFDLVTIWYLCDSGHAAGNSEDRMARYAKAITGSVDSGIDVLHCKSIFVPRTTGRVLIEKIGNIDKEVLHNLNAEDEIPRQQ
jgi:hypothetical protein